MTYTQAWDAENRLTAVTNTATLSVTKFIYDGDGQRVKKIAPNGQATSLLLGNTLTAQYAYGPLNFRLKRIQVGSLLDLSYGYDNVGNITVITDVTNSNQKQTFAYDPVDRLTSAALSIIHA